MKQTLECAWDELSDKLRRFIRARVEDDAAADDILQETFLRLHQRFAGGVEPESLSGWLHLVARRAIVDHYRARKPAAELPATLAAEAAPSADEAMLCAAFRRMVDLLPEPYREAVVLSELEGMTQLELARRLGISHSGAKSRVQRGREQLREMLEACCHFERDHRGRVMGAEPKAKGNCPECE